MSEDCSKYSNHWLMFCCIMYTAVPLSINKIFEEVMNRQEGRSLTLDHIRASLVLLGCVRGSDDTYQIGNPPFAFYNHNWLMSELCPSIVL